MELMHFKKLTKFVALLGNQKKCIQSLSRFIDLAITKMLLFTKIRVFVFWGFGGLTSKNHGCH